MQVGSLCMCTFLCMSQCENEHHLGRESSSVKLCMCVCHFFFFFVSVSCSILIPASGLVEVSSGVLYYMSSFPVSSSHSCVQRFAVGDAIGSVRFHPSRLALGLYQSRWPTVGRGLRPYPSNRRDNRPTASTTCETH